MGATVARIAAVEGLGSAAAQHLFAIAIDRWRLAGVRVAGLLEETHGAAGRTCSAGKLRDIASGQSHSIYLDTLPAGRICHIDAAGAEEAGAGLLAQIAAADVVVLSKFGKLETERGGGLRHAFEIAMDAGKPLLTAVSERHRAAWRRFAPHAAILPPSAAAIEAWWETVGARAP
ncbi:DUF2478 domain-containing protein [Hyphomicrobium sp.]|uniref:DUF2478 domain-containing protein n=1 Tax=Hyphomicrobium sp. TaxID=82 RepID=UPI002FDE1DB8